MKTSIAVTLPGHEPLQTPNTIESGPAVCPPSIEIGVAETAEEIDAFFAVRKAVFVREQGIFTDSDRDKFDKGAIAIVAKVDGVVVGVVRCYRKSRGTWFGGRLAVLENYRKYNLGASLVRKAVETMEKRADVQKFMASIQIQNVRFFRRLGWETLGRRFVLKGVRHWMMVKPLERPAADFD